MDAAQQPMPEEPPARDWSLLPLDVLSSVFVMVGAVDVLMGAGLVCRSWLQAARLPDVWRVVDMEHEDFVPYGPDDFLVREHDDLRAMAKAAVDRSGGQLQVFTGKEFVTNELMQYIVERSPSLTTLRLVSFRDDDFSTPLNLAGVIRESPLSELRSLKLDDVDITVEELTTVLENCPVLEVLRMSYCFGINNEDEHALRVKFAGINILTEGDGFSDSDCEISGPGDIPDCAYFD